MLPSRCTSSGTLIHNHVWALSLFLLLGSFLLPRSLAILVNSTVDDTLPDPRTGDKILYTPDGAWNEGGANCGQCITHPDEQSVYRGTWHEGMSGGSNGTLVASMAFTGSAIYVYCVLPRNILSGYTDLTFTLDNQPVGTFQRTPPGGEGYDYDVLVFSTTSLSGDRRHHFFVSSGKRDGPSSTIIFDRIIYSYDDGTKTSSIGTIAGIVVGTLAGVALLCALFFYFLRYRRRRRNTASQGPVLIDPDLDDDGQPIDYPTVEPYTQSHSRQNTQPNSSESRSGSAGSPTTATAPTSRAVKGRPRVPLQKPSQASISLSLPYSANDVDIYDPYGRLSISASGTGTASDTLPVTATSTIYAAASTSSGGSTTVRGSDNQPPPAYESIPLIPRNGKSDREKKDKRGSTENSKGLPPPPR